MKSSLTEKEIPGNGANKNNQHFLYAALEAAKGGMWEWNLETREVWMSPEMYKLWGIEPDKKFTTRNSLALIDKRDRQHIKKIMAENFKQKTQFQYEFRMVHPSLGERWMESRGRIIRKHKRAVRLVGITIDITERKLIESALEESEKRFSATFYQSIVAMSLADSQGNWLAINSAYSNMFGYTPEELKALHPKDLLFTDDFEMSRKAFSQLIKGQIPSLRQERRYIHKNGSLIYGNVSATLVKDPSGKLRYVVTVIEDITERKRAEIQLKESEERFRTLIEQSADVIQLISAEGKLLYTSNSITRVLGYTPEEVLGDNGKPYIHPDDFERYTKAFSFLLGHPENKISLEYRIRHKNGKWLWVEATGANHLTNPAVKAIVGTFRDITERKQLEKQKDEFLGIVSHELRTPVTSLKAYAQLLQKQFSKAGDMDSASMLSKMVAQINKLTSLIQDLLDVSRAESGKLTIRRAPCNLDELVREIVEEVQRITTDHRIVIVGKTGKTIFADRDRIGQVLTNLLTNAVKYSPHDSQIKVHLGCDTKETIVYVQDKGVGIPKDQLPYVFDRFFRVSGKSHDTVPGMGLGLNIASEIIRRHNGHIWAESTFGKGSRFYFSLPLNEK